MPLLILQNANVFDGESEELLVGHHVLIEGDRIREVSDTPIAGSGADRLDVNGAVVMPGLIDAHVHAVDWGASPAELGNKPASYTALRAAQNLRKMLHRGFTTVRDACGADFGLAAAACEGLIESPRLFFVGKALSATGGHGDFRDRGDDRYDDVCACADRGLSVIVDGEPAVRQAARNELRKGAHAVKIMASGGVASPTDPIGNLQFSEAEIRAIVEEASFWGAYVMAHAYTAEAIARSVEYGVRSIEHANLIDLDTAKLATEKGAYVVPTLVVYAAMHERGGEIGMPNESLAKVADVRSAGLQSLEYLRQAKTPTGFGTDLFGDLQAEQLREFVIRAEVDANVDVLRSATSINARLLGKEGELGCIRPGACADLLIVQGNPLEDISVLLNNDGQVSHIMQAGRFVRQP
jgi:imidazolonepropionase-like amidohydrolase